MNRMFTFLLCIISIYAGNTVAQQNYFTEVVYDSLSFVEAYSVVESYEGDFIIAGSQLYNNAMITRIDTTGNIIWCKSIGINQDGYFIGITRTHDSCYAAAGMIGPWSNRGMFCAKFNSAGDTVWTRKINFGSYSRAYCIQQTYDKGFIITGKVSPSSLPGKIALTKLDSAGMLSWSKVYSIGNSDNAAYSVKQTSDSCYIVIGTAENNNPFNRSLLLMKINPAGNVIWAIKHNTSSPDYSQGYDVEVTPDGLICYMQTSTGGINIFKTDQAGNLIWNKNFPWYYGGLENAHLKSTSDGGFIFATSDMYFSDLIKIDSNGNLLWSYNLLLKATDLTECNDKGFLVVGNGPIYGVKDHYIPHIGIIKTDSTGFSSDCINPNYNNSVPSVISFSPALYTSADMGSLNFIQPLVSDITLNIDSGCVTFLGSTNDIQLDENEITIYPNPFSSSTSIESKHKLTNAELSVYNSFGQSVYRADNISGHTVVFNGEKFAPGLYYMRLSSNNNILMNRKVMIIR